VNQKILHKLHDELALDRESVQKSFIQHIQHTQGKHPDAATPLDHYVSAVRVARDRCFDRWTRTWQERKATQPKQVYYLSMEFLLGRLLDDALLNLGIREAMAQALAEVGIDLQQVLDEEEDAGLGNGGLGRLAACFMDSMASLGVVGMGYGLRYEYGIFRQEIVGGSQQEKPDHWLEQGNPWEIERPERRFKVQFGGRVIHYTNAQGRRIHEWIDTYDVYAMAYDTPVVGYRNNVINTLRLWAAKATQDFDISYFNRGDYIKAVEEKSATENITRVLYPNDNDIAGKELRLKQEYFLVSATLQDALRRHLDAHPTPENLPDLAIFQLNDTHPTLAIVELMRLLTDQYGIPRDQAWDITRRSMAYTNHTMLPEALEKWPVWLMERLLPRHMQIIYDINHHFLGEMRAKYPGDAERLARVSLVEEGTERRVRMAHLAVVGSSRVNGVSALHSRLIREELFSDFDEMEPGKFINVTNGVTPRRWLLKCNPGLSKLITSCIGDGWVTNLTDLQRLVPYAQDSAFQAAFRDVKQKNKERLASFLWEEHREELPLSSIVDSHVKRIHEYKRQLLNILHVISLYLRYQKSPPVGKPPRTFVFAGKAAPGYEMAKRIIHLITSVGNVVNHDPIVRQYLRVIFVPNYKVSVAELIIPATDVSEQISTAGMEASGTGNMKFALNGALTIGTLDGANVEMLEAIGGENMFIFGLETEEVAAARKSGQDPWQLYYSAPELRAVLDAVSNGMFSPDSPSRFRPTVDALLSGGDYYMVLADFLSYSACQRAVEDAYTDPELWTKKAILNVARMGFFSSDNSIRRYAREVWNVPLAGQ